MTELKWPSTTIWVQVEDRGEMRLREMQVHDLFEELDDGERGPIAVYRFSGDILVIWDYAPAYLEHQQDRADQIQHDAGLRRMQRP